MAALPCWRGDLKGKNILSRMSPFYALILPVLAMSHKAPGQTAPRGVQLQGNMQNLLRNS